MVRGVNSLSAQVRARRVAETETKLIEAAARLFAERGYVATTLTAVAEAAGLAPRTVYLRFDTKVALFRRTMDVMLVGDSAPVDVAHREWMHRALTAPTSAERIGLMARGTCEMFSRIGPLLAVTEQAAAIEPAIAAATQDARETTRDLLRRFWAALDADGLLPAAADTEWLANTAVMSCSADAYLHASRTLGWSAETYAGWLEKTWLRILDASDARNDTVTDGAGINVEDRRR